ncbi:MAG TPA: N(5)-(carboxyethyl)ornithine synthase [Egibacteraceae bacterium]|nr:N(5)-(carboxyethyl)ornithine synthase [Egibacteraceae bacterium]
MGQLDIGIIGTSNKDGDLRRPIHPLHFDRVDDAIRRHLYVEHGYGEHFGVTDDRIAPLVAGMRTRDELIAETDVILLPKPTHADVEQLREGQVLWGWPHCVQDEHVTQMAIDRRLTMIAWEAMNHWSSEGAFSLHVFHKNNELAGYCSVLHALQELGRTGHYGPRMRAVVLSFGATARGAVTALYGLGVTDVTVLTQRDTTRVAYPIPGVLYGQFERVAPGSPSTVALKSTGPVPTAQFLAGFDIIVNCVLQDPTSPLLFVDADEVDLFDPGTLFVDVSCDEGMGFYFARPTSFVEPMFGVGRGAWCYGVDHSPSYLWNAATWEISEALIPYLGVVTEGPSAWDANATISRAIEVRQGQIVNPLILQFQGRDADYPHRRR